MDGNVIEGKQEKAVSRELFLKVNNTIQNGYQYVISHEKESEITPMKGFLRCGCCNGPMTGYVVKTKWENGIAKPRKIFPAYYKCNIRGCKNNISAKTIHEAFMNLLTSLRVSEKEIPLLLCVMESKYQEGFQDQSERIKNIDHKLKELDKDIENLERKYYIKEEMSKEIFEKFRSQLQREKDENIKKLSDVEKTLSNPLKSFEKTLEICSKLPEIWSCKQYEVKERLQRVMFPEGIIYDKEKQAYRTLKINSVFR